MRKNQPRVARRGPVRPAPVQPKVSSAKAKLHAELLYLKRELKRLEVEIDIAKPKYSEFPSNSEAAGRKHGQTVLKCMGGRSEYVSRRLISGNSITHERLLKLHARKLQKLDIMISRYNHMR